MQDILLDVFVKLPVTALILIKDLLCRIVQPIEILLLLNRAAISTMEYLNLGKLGGGLISG